METICATTPKLKCPVQVKIMLTKLGHRIIVNGTAKVIIDETIKLLTEGESIYIPLGSKHRLENPGLVPMLLVEVQTGSYLGEDDIIRYEDIYNRNLNK